MEMVIEAVASHKQGVKVLGKWFSADKFSKPDFTVLNPGDVIDAVVLQDKFVKSYTFKDGSTRVATASAPAQAAPARPFAPTPDKDASIAKAVALKAAIELAASCEELNDDQKFSKVASWTSNFMTFLNTGKFE